MTKAANLVSTKMKTRKSSSKGKRPGRFRSATGKEAALLATTSAVKRSRPKKEAGTKAAPLRAEPGPDGLKLLAIVEAYKRLWANPPDQDKYPRAFDRHEQRSWSLNTKANAVVRRIGRRIPCTFSDLMDLLIAFQWRYLNGYGPSDIDEMLVSIGFEKLPTISTIKRQALRRSAALRAYSLGAAVPAI